MTLTQKQLWRELRKPKLDTGLHFRPQAQIVTYGVDFACPAGEPTVEADGGVHVLRRARDAVRHAWREGRRYRAARFENNPIVKTIDASVAAMLAAVRAGATAAGLSPQGGGET